MQLLKKWSLFLILFALNFIFFACETKEIDNIKTNISTTYHQITNKSNPSDSINNSENFDSINYSNQFVQTQTPKDSTKNYVYLTFDDGPFKGSEKINKIIKEENVKATVFIVGMNAYTDKLKQHLKDYENNDLIEVSNHTFSHANRNKFKQYYDHPNWVLEDVKKNDSIYKFNNRFVRLPGRNIWRLGKMTKDDFDLGSKNSSDLLAQNQYYVLGWDYEWNKISKNHPIAQPEEIYEGILNRIDNKQTFTNKHLVILMHDDMFDDDKDAEKLRKLIRLIKNNKDFVFEVASNYPFSLS